MNKLLIALFFCSSMATAQTVTIQTRPASGSGSWTNRQTKLIDIQSGFTPLSERPTQLNKYGSRTDIKGNVTGFFHAQYIDGRWWIVDPEGGVGFNIAMNSLNGVKTVNDVQSHYDRLWNLGFNGIGNFLTRENDARDYYNNKEENADRQFSYTRRINFYAGYSQRRKSYYPNTPAVATNSSTRGDYVFTLDPTFPQYCADLVKSGLNIARYKDEPNLLGYFLDNEINFNQDLLKNFLANMPVDDPAYLAAYNFITEKGVALSTAQVGSAPEAVKQEFASMIAERYYHVTDSVLKIYDPNHMNLGSRLHGRPRAIEGVVKACAKYCDIVSVNFYDKFSPADQICSPTVWGAWIDKPCLVTEFYTKGLDATTSGYVNGYSGAGWVVKTQTDRGYFYQNTCIDLMQSRYFVGWHYFKHQDDTDSNKGILNTSGKEYTELTSLMQTLNWNVFAYVDFYDNRTSVETSMADEFHVFTTSQKVNVEGSCGNGYELTLYSLQGVLMDSCLGNSLPIHKKGAYVLGVRDNKQERFFKIMIY